MRPWQRTRMIISNTVLVVLGLGALGWQVWRNLAQGEPYLWAPFLLTVAVVVIGAGLLVYAVRTTPEPKYRPPGR